MAINRLTGSPTVAVTTRCAINVAECIPLCSTGVGSANINKKYIKKKTHPMRYNLSSTDLREKKKKIIIILSRDNSPGVSPDRWPFLTRGSQHTVYHIEFLIRFREIHTWA